MNELKLLSKKYQTASGNRPEAVCKNLYCTTILRVTVSLPLITL